MDMTDRGLGLWVTWTTETEHLQVARPTKLHHTWALGGTEIRALPAPGPGRAHFRKQHLHPPPAWKKKKKNSCAGLLILPGLRSLPSMSEGGSGCFSLRICLYRSGQENAKNSKFSALPENILSRVPNAPRREHDEPD